MSNSCKVSAKKDDSRERELGRVLEDPGFVDGLKDFSDGRVTDGIRAGVFATRE
jgi:hypothetical protein